MNWLNLITGRQLPQTITLIVALWALWDLFVLVRQNRLVVLRFNWLTGTAVFMALLNVIAFYIYVLFVRQHWNKIDSNMWSAMRSLHIVLTIAIYLHALRWEWNRIR